MKLKEKAFTLIELLIVIAIIAILAAAVIIAVNPGEQLAKARDATRERHVKALESALYVHYYDHFYFPNIPEGFTEICDTEKENPNCEGLVDLSSLTPTYMASIPKDPSGGVNENGTGYKVATRENERVVIYAPQSEVSTASTGGLPGYYWSFDDSLTSSEGIEPDPGYVATLRPGEGKFGGAVAVEEGTENLMTPDRRKFLGPSWRDFAGNIVGTVEEGHGIPGITHNGTLVTIPASPDGDHNPVFWGFSNQGDFLDFSGSAWIYNVGDHAIHATFSNDITWGGQWIQPGEIAKVEIKGTSGDLGYNHRFTTSRANKEHELKFIGYQLQVEQKSFPTSFVEGTREIGFLKYNINSEEEKFTISTFLELKGDDYSCCFRILRIRNSNDYSFFELQTTGSDINTIKTRQIIDGNPNDGVINTSRNTKHHLVVTFNDGERKVYLDGELIHQWDNQVSENIFSLEFSPNKSQLYDDLIIFPYALTEEDIQELYNQGL